MSVRRFKEFYATGRHRRKLGGIDDNSQVQNGKTLIYNNSTISLEDIKEEDFEVISRARYNTTIVVGTSCTQVEKKVEGTMVTLYETNPNAAKSLNSNLARLILLLIVIQAIS